MTEPAALPPASGPSAGQRMRVHALTTGSDPHHYPALHPYLCRATRFEIVREDDHLGLILWNHHHGM